MVEQDQVGTPTEQSVPRRAWIACAVLAAVVVLATLLLAWFVF